jgi:hypothetical protein
MVAVTGGPTTIVRWSHVASSPSQRVASLTFLHHTVGAVTAVKTSISVNIGFPSMRPVKVQAVIPHFIKAVTCTPRVPDRPTERGTDLLYGENLGIEYTSVYSYSLFLTTLPNHIDSR